MFAFFSLTIALSSCGSDESVGGDGIILEQVGTLGEGRDEDGALYGLRRVVFDSKERAIVIAADNHDGMPFVLESNGNFVTVLGRPGEGPGELVEPGAIHVDQQDSVFVWDSGTGRMSVFGPEHDFVRTYAVEAYAGGTAVRFATGDWLHGSNLNSGFRFLMIGSDGKPICQWGDSVDYVSPRNGAPIRMPWRIGPGSAGTAWAIKSRFRLTALRFDSAGSQLADLRLTADWFEPYNVLRQTAPDQAPQPMVRAIHEDSAGLWIVGQTADPDWRSALGEPFRVEGSTAYRVEDWSRLLDTIIELRDPDTGELRARYRDDRVISAGSGGNRSLVSAWREDDLGFQIRDVYRVRYDPAPVESEE